MSPARADTLKLLTLDLISPARRVEQSQIDDLTTADWAHVMRMAQRHRIAPLVRWQLQHTHDHLRVPTDVAAALKQAFELSLLDSLAMQRVLLCVHDVLGEAKVPYAVLKGPYLAYQIYPHPALRPMRDLDILVPAARLREARDLLLGSGMAPGPRHSMPDGSPHLPPLYAGHVPVELHRRALHLGRYRPSPGDPTADPDFWDRRICFELAGRSIWVPSTNDQLVHLIIHAVWDHHFSNGPLFLSDLGLLSRSGSVDWAALTEHMDRLGATRPRELALALSQRYWGNSGATAARLAAPTENGADIKRTAALLMLRDTDWDGEAAFLHDLRRAQTASHRAQLFFRSALPPRSAMATMFPRHADSPLLLACYPLRWFRLAVQRIASARRAMTTGAHATDVGKLMDLHQWLSSD